MTGDVDASEASLGQLGALCSSWRDVQQTRLALEQRGLDGPAASLLKVERGLGRATTRALKAHPIYEWLRHYPGLRGIHVARLVSIIDDPRRFPGQGCTEGHAFLPVYAVGDACPFGLGPDKTPCPGTVVERRGSGVRSLWRYLGLDVVEGRSPRKVRGHQAHWHMQGRSCVLQPGGIAEQIVRQSVEPYVSIYRDAKARLARVRGLAPAETIREIDTRSGGREAGVLDELDAVRGLRPFQIDAIARKIAAKAFVADLLTAWKRLLEPPIERAA